MIHIRQKLYRTSPVSGNIRAALLTAHNCSAISRVGRVFSCYLGEKYDLIDFDAAIIGNDLLLNLVVALLLARRGRRSLLVLDSAACVKYDAHLVNTAKYAYYDTGVREAIESVTGIHLGDDLIEAVERLVHELNNIEFSDSPPVMLAGGYSIKPDAGICNGEEGRMLLWPGKLPTHYRGVDDYEKLKSKIKNDVPRLTLADEEMSIFTSRAIYVTSDHPYFSYDCARSEFVRRVHNEECTYNEACSFDPRLRHEVFQGLSI